MDRLATFCRDERWHAECARVRGVVREYQDYVTSGGKKRGPLLTELAGRAMLPPLQT